MLRELGSGAQPVYGWSSLPQVLWHRRKSIVHVQPILILSRDKALASVCFPRYRGGVVWFCLPAAQYDVACHSCWPVPDRFIC